MMSQDLQLFTGSASSSSANHEKCYIVHHQITHHII